MDKLEMWPVLEVSNTDHFEFRNSCTSTVRDGYLLSSSSCQPGPDGKTVWAALFVAPYALSALAAAGGLFKPERVDLDDLAGRLLKFEREYGYSTVAFYRRFKSGELGDDDDFMLWAGYADLYFTAAQKAAREGGDASRKQAP